MSRYEALVEAKAFARAARTAILPHATADDRRLDPVLDALDVVFRELDAAVVADRLGVPPEISRPNS